MSYQFNKERALVILPELLRSVKEKEFIFSIKGMSLPDERIPESLEEGSREHAIFLMTFCALTARMPSNSLYDSYSDFFSNNMDVLENSGIKTMETILAHNLKMGLAKKRASEIIKRRRVLDLRYSGDPRNIYSEFPDPRGAIHEMAKGKSKLPGFAYKTAALFTQYAHKYSFAEFETPERLLPAIDTHKMRILEMTGILSYDSDGKVPSRVRSQLSEKFAIELSDFCIDEQIDLLSIDEALWVLGSEVCAKDNTVYCGNVCPLLDFCAQEYTKERGAKLVRSMVKGRGQGNLFR